MVADRGQAMTGQNGRKVTPDHADQLTPLTSLTALHAAKEVKKVKKVTDHVRGAVTALTPWKPAAPPLSQVRHHHHGRPLGRVPTRRQVLAGYRDPDTERLVEGQVPRAIRELGADASVQEIADRLAVWAGDQEFLEVLFNQLGVAVEILPWRRG